MKRNAAILLVAACALPALAVAVDAHEIALARIASALEDARRIDRPTRQFVGLYLRAAGVAWILVEWIAAAYVIRGFVLLRRWFAEMPR